MNFQSFIKYKKKNKTTTTTTNKQKDPAEDAVQWPAGMTVLALEKGGWPFTDCEERLTSLVSMLILSLSFSIQIRSVQALPSHRVQGWAAVCPAA